MNRLSIKAIAAVAVSMALTPLANSAEIQVVVDRRIQSGSCSATNFGVAAQGLKKYAEQLLIRKGYTIKQSNPKGGSKLLLMLNTCGYEAAPGQGLFVGTFALAPVGISSGKSSLRDTNEVGFAASHALERASSSRLTICLSCRGRLKVKIGSVSGASPFSYDFCVVT